MLAYVGAERETREELHKALGLGNLPRSAVLRNYVFERTYQVSDEPASMRAQRVAPTCMRFSSYRTLERLAKIWATT